MKITEQWITEAIAALAESGIVRQRKEGDRTAFFFPKEFKGYISSFAATIVQSGLLPALDIYEREDSDAASSRHLLPQAIVCLLRNHKILEPKNSFKLSDYWNEAASREWKQEFQKSVEKALVALKLAIRMFKPETIEGGKKKENTSSPKQTSKSAGQEPEYIEDTTIPSVENLQANVGWLYYRDYYHNYAVNHKKTVSYPILKNGRPTDKREETSKHEYLLKYRKTPFLLSSKLNNMLTANQQMSKDLTKSGFASLTFRTLYPGLIIGLGLSHGTPTEGDLKCGFQFDYATGLPIIPGSSVKGVLRSVFPNPDGKADERDKQKARYIARLLCKRGIELKEEKMLPTVRQLARQIFEHDDANRHGTDVFMDAILTGPAQGRFLADDYLTPHDGYKNPVPIQFLKVLPNIEFTFFFKLTAFKIGENKVDKLDLFCHILEDVGIGAKTNVGYGHLIKIK